MLDLAREWIEKCLVSEDLAFYLDDLRGYETELASGETDRISAAESGARELIRVLKTINLSHARSVRRIRLAVNLKPITVAKTTNPPLQIPVLEEPPVLLPTIDLSSAPKSSPENVKPLIPLPILPKKPRPQGEQFVSKAFRWGIAPDMFYKPDEMSDKQLKDLCTLYNFAMKKHQENENAALLQLGIKGNRSGDVDPKNLKGYAEALWKMAFKDEDALPDMPSEEQLKELQLQEKWNWQKGKPWEPEDAVKKERPSEIANAKVDLTSPQKVWIDEKKLIDMNKSLEEAGSFLKFEVIPPKGGSDPSAPSGFVQIKPVWNAERPITPATVKGEDHEKLLKVNTEGDENLPQGTYASWADCHRTAQSIMGSQDTPSSIQDKEVVTVRGLDKPVTPLSKQHVKTISSASDHGTNRAMHATMNATVPDFIKGLLKDLGYDKSEEIPAEALKLEIEKLEKEGGDPKILRALKLAKSLREKKDIAVYDDAADLRGIYNQINQDDELSGQFSEKFGLNDKMTPKVGTALSILNDEYEKSNTVGKDLWNFHFAGIVMVNDDGSYMTMENMSTEDPTAINDNWFFALYEKDGPKSFHGIYSKDPGFGDNPITIQLEKAL